MYAAQCGLPADFLDTVEASGSDKAARREHHWAPQCYDHELSYISITRDMQLAFKWMPLLAPSADTFDTKYQNRC